MIFQWIGLMEYIPCYSAPALHWGLLPATRLASRKILIEQNIKKRTGPALCVLCGPSCRQYAIAQPLGSPQSFSASLHQSRPHPAAASPAVSLSSLVPASTLAASWRLADLPQLSALSSSDGAVSQNKIRIGSWSVFGKCSVLFFKTQ